MKCPKCGEPMPEGIKFCTECGAKLPSRPDTPLNQPCARPVASADAQPRGTAPQQDSLQLQPGMKWFKFLIYFALWCAAVSALWNAVQLLTGSIYGTDAELVYGLYPQLKLCNIILGLVQLIYAAGTIYTRFMLAGFRRNGPVCLYALYLADDLSQIVYLLASGAILGTSLFTADLLLSAASTVIFQIINFTYLRKRGNLFVN